MLLFGSWNVTTYCSLTSYKFDVQIAGWVSEGLVTVDNGMFSSAGCSRLWVRILYCIAFYCCSFVFSVSLYINQMDRQCLKDGKTVHIYTSINEIRFRSSF